VRCHLEPAVDREPVAVDFRITGLFHQPYVSRRTKGRYPRDRRHRHWRSRRRHILRSLRSPQPGKGNQDEEHRQHSQRHQTCPQDRPPPGSFGRRRGSHGLQESQASYRVVDMPGNAIDPGPWSVRRRRARSHVCHLVSADREKYLSPAVKTQKAQKNVLRIFPSQTAYKEKTKVLL
jgi:hypothetical protein